MPDVAVVGDDEGVVADAEPRDRRGEALGGGQRERVGRGGIGELADEIGEARAGDVRALPVAARPLRTSYGSSGERGRVEVHRRVEHDDVRHRRGRSASQRSDTSGPGRVSMPL